MNKIRYSFIFLLLSVSFLQAQEMSIFLDKFAFKTAQEMYEVADTLPFDKNAASLIEQIRKDLPIAKIIESRSIWGKLEKLEPYRQTAQVQALVDECVTNSITKPKRIYNEQFKRAANYYYQKDFKNVVESSLKILRNEDKAKNSAQSSATTTSFEFALRNNMALALMHLNKDLCAQVELEIIFQQCGIYKTGIPKYRKNEDEEFIPAAINLTVVYERLGFSEKAKNISKQLIEYVYLRSYTIPTVAFNAIWFLDNGELLKNEALINNVMPVLQASKQEKYDNEIQHITLRKELEQEKYNDEIRRETLLQPFWKIGIAYKYDLSNKAAIIILLLSSLVAWIICAIVVLNVEWIMDLMDSPSAFFIALSAIILVLSFLLFVTIFGTCSIFIAGFWWYMILSPVAGFFFCLIFMNWIMENF